MESEIQPELDSIRNEATELKSEIEKEVKKEGKNEASKVANASTVGSGESGCVQLGHALQANPIFLKISTIVHWRDIVLSALSFVIGNALFFLVTYGEYTYTTLFSYSVILLSLSTLIVSRLQLMRGGSIDFINQLFGGQDEDTIRATVESSIQVYVAFKNFLLDILKWSNFPATLILFVSLLLLSQFAKVISGTTLLYIGFLLAFSLPKAYEFKKDLIDQQVSNIVKIIDEKWKIVEAKAPFLTLKVKG